MTAPTELNPADRAFMLNAFESDILAGVWGDLPEPLASGPASDLVPIVLALVDRGWIEVCRYEHYDFHGGRVGPWTLPAGPGNRPGEAIPREELPSALSVREEWEYPDNGEWTGRLTLVRTADGEEIPV
ncbi:hypothetical protein ACWCOW_34960 [Streptomyces sp. NPDC001939]